MDPEYRIGSDHDLDEQDTGVCYAELVQRLGRLRRYDRLIAGIRGTAWGLAILLLGSLLGLVLDALLWLPGWLRLSWAILIGAGGSGWILWFGLVAALRGRSLESLALRVETHFPSLHNRLINGLQLGRDYRRHLHYYSPRLLQAVIRQASEALQPLDLRPIADRRGARKALTALSVTLLLSTVLVGGFEQPFKLALQRFTHPFDSTLKLYAVRLVVQPGDLEIPRGESVQIDVTVQGQTTHPVLIRSTHAGDPQWLTQPLQRSPSQQPGPGIGYRHRLARVRGDLDYYIQVGETHSPVYHIRVFDRPLITAFRLTYDYPSYTRLGRQVVEKVRGDLEGLKGTHVDVAALFNRPMRAGHMVFSDSTTQRLMAQRQTLRGQVEIHKDLRYRIVGVDSLGYSNPEAIEFRITALADQPPAVRIVEPGRDLDLSEQMQVSLVISASDDFGFSALAIVYHINDQPEPDKIPIPLSHTAASQITETYRWQLDGLKLLPEDLVHYYVEVYDNDTVSGPKRAVSETYLLRFPSLYEIYNQVAEQENEQIDTLEEVLNEGRELKERLENMARDLQSGVAEMAKEGGLDWQEKKSLEQMLEQQKQLAEQVQQAAETIDEIVQKLEQNQLATPEVLERLQQIQELLKQITTPEMQAIMEKLQQAMQQLDQQVLDRAMKEFNTSQQEFLERLDRTLSVLKRLQQEQKMDAAVRKAEELYKQQQKTYVQTQQQARQPANPAQQQELSQHQKSLGKDAAQLQQDLTELAESLKDEPNMPVEQTQSVATTMDQKQLPQRMSEIGTQIAQGQMGPAMTGQQNTLEDLQELLEQLKGAQLQMKQSQKSEIAQAMRRAMRDLLYLSQGEEELLTETSQKVNPMQRNDQMKALTERQMGLAQGAAQVTDALYETAQKSFFITPEIGKSLGESLAQMQSATRNLSQSNSRQASRNAAAAMTALNRTVMELRKAMQSLNLSNSASGLGEMLQRLERLAQGQLGLNQGLDQLMRQRGEQGGQLTPEQQAAMARLAAEQQAIRKSLEDLQREIGNRSEILGRLDTIAGDMARSIEQMQQQQMGRELIDRQHRILSRLLDARLSLHQRDYGKRRRSEVGQDYHDVAGPKGLPADLGQRRSQLREDLLEALKEGYPREYEALIRAYFRALSEIEER